MDNKLLPFILQHVRELAEAQLGINENERIKIITPFPPSLNDFPDFISENLSFSDPETSGDEKIKDTWKAYEFSELTDNLYYNFSYGIQSPDQTLTAVCRKFSRDAVFVPDASAGFIASFTEMKTAFLERFKRSTVGDLGLPDFQYCFPGPVKWNSSPIVLNAGEINRLRDKAVAVYQSVEDTGYLAAMLEELRNSLYSEIRYDMGFFEVIRHWVDPVLFEDRGWKFTNPESALYAETDLNFKQPDVRLCYAQRFYVIRNVSGKVQPVTTPAPALVSRPAAIVRDHRTRIRNSQLFAKLVVAAKPEFNTRSRAGFVWVKDHWERKRASPPPAIVVPEAEQKSLLKVAAVLARVIPWKPTDA